MKRSGCRTVNAFRALGIVRARIASDVSHVDPHAFTLPLEHRRAIRHVTRAPSTFPYTPRIGLKPSASEHFDRAEITRVP